MSSVCTYGENIRFQLCCGTATLMPITNLLIFQDALALIRLDDLFLESFEVTDGKQFLLRYSSSCVLPAASTFFCFFSPTPLGSHFFRDQENLNVITQNYCLGTGSLKALSLFVRCLNKTPQTFILKSLSLCHICFFLSQCKRCFKLKR